MKIGIFALFFSTNRTNLLNWLIKSANRKYKGCFDEHGQRTPEGDRIYQDYFTGDKAWFTDSSESEKHNFKSSLTFLDPENKKEHIFCPWHGKINTPKMRIHFSWPISHDKPLHMVYIGHKLTKK